MSAVFLKATIFLEKGTSTVQHGAFGISCPAMAFFQD